MIEIGQWGALAIQIPVVVAFIVFTTMMLRSFLDHLKTQSELERQQRLQAMQMGMREVDKLCENIEKLSEAVAENNKVVLSHNEASKGRHEHLIYAMENRLKPGGQ